MTGEPKFTVKKYGAYVPVSLEMALDTGMITEEEARAQGWTPPTIIRIPRRQRARWYLAEVWGRVRTARRVLAGDDLHEDCE